MPLEGEYEPSSWDWVRNQVEQIESSGGTEGLGLFDTDLPVVIVTSVGNKTGKLRKNPVMRVEHEGKYVAIGSVGGAPKNPVWVYNIRANPHVELQDGSVKQDMIAREITGEEKALWWDRAVAVYPEYAAYQAATERVIPVFLLEPIG
jgi:deazaflavin-dependent oxidoreductase (nitroreductase family)